MYYEEAEVKEYFRKDRKGNKKPYYQIGLKKSSKFNEAKPIALIDISEIKEIAENLDIEKLNEIKATLKETSEENKQLKQELKELKATNKKLDSKKDKLQEELLEAKDNVAKEKDISKTLLLALYSYEERSYFFYK